MPGNVISQTLHCVSVHGYLTSVWSSTSSVVVTTAWVVLSISKMLPYSLNLCLIWHGHVVVCCIFMEAWGYVRHSPIILSIPNPDFPVLYPILWSHSMDQPFAQRSSIVLEMVWEKKKCDNDVNSSLCCLCRSKEKTFKMIKLWSH